MRRRGRFDPVCLRVVILAGLVSAGAGQAVLAATAAAAEPTTHELIRDGVAAIRESNYPRAAQFFAQAATIDPDFTRAHFGLALAALGRGDRKEFDKSLRRLDALTHGAPEVRYILAVQKWMTGDLRVAEEELRGASRLDPSFLEARYTLGVVESAQGKLQEAASSLHEALLIDDGHAPSRFQLGTVLAAGGDLQGAVQELRVAVSIDPELGATRPEERLLFADRRVLLGNAHGGGFGLPLPLPRPTFIPIDEKRNSAPAAGPRPVPEWYLDYAIALNLEDEGHWDRAVVMLERALSLNAREELQVPVADQLVDYLPHRHLAKSCYETGDLQEALLHLEAARNQGAEPPDSLRLLETLVKIASGRTSIVLQPIPDHTSDNTVAIRGILLARDSPPWIDVGEQRALLRAASPEERRALLTESATPPADAGIKTLYFEVPMYRLLSDGPNFVRIRPGGTAFAGAEIELLIVKDVPARGGGGSPAVTGTKP